MGKKISLNNLQSLSVQLRTVFATKSELVDLALIGPDGKMYKLAINKDFRLVLEEYINPNQVQYMISGANYFYLEEDDDGILYLTQLTTELPSDATTGYLRAVSGDDGVKYQLDIENGSVIFTPYEGTEIDENEARYLVCINNPEKVYYFKIEEGYVFLERISIESVMLNIK